MTWNYCVSRERKDREQIYLPLSLPNDEIGPKSSFKFSCLVGFLNMYAVYQPIIIGTTFIWTSYSNFLLF